MYVGIGALLKLLLCSLHLRGAGAVLLIRILIFVPDPDPAIHDYLHMKKKVGLFLPIPYQNILYFL